MDGRDKCPFFQGLAEDKGPNLRGEVKTSIWTESQMDLSLIVWYALAWGEGVGEGGMMVADKWCTPKRRCDVQGRQVGPSTARELSRERSLDFPFSSYFPVQPFHLYAQTSPKDQNRDGLCS